MNNQNRYSDNRNIYSDIASVSAGIGTQAGLKAGTFGYATGLSSLKDRPTSLGRLIDIKNNKAFDKLDFGNRFSASAIMRDQSKSPLNGPSYFHKLDIVKKGFGKNNPGILAHELGHKAYHDLFRKKFGNRLGNTLARAPRLVAGGGMLTGLTVPFFTRDKETARNTALVGSGLGGLVVADEAIASGIGSRIINRLNKKMPSAAKRISRLSPWVGIPTYIAGALSPYLTYKAIDLAGGYDAPKN